MARPTSREKQIVIYRNNLIKELVVDGYTQAEVAKYFNINRATVNLIVNNKI